MAFALINCTVHGQERIQALICVNHVAYTFLMAFTCEASSRMQLGIKEARQKYKKNVMAAIAGFDTTVQPHLSLLYALQSAVGKIMPNEQLPYHQTNITCSNIGYDDATGWSNAPMLAL